MLHLLIHHFIHFWEHRFRECYIFWYITLFISEGIIWRNITSFEAPLYSFLRACFDRMLYLLIHHFAISERIYWPIVTSFDASCPNWCTTKKKLWERSLTGCLVFWHIALPFLIACLHRVYHLSIHNATILMGIRGSGLPKKVSLRIFQLSHTVLHSYQSVQCVRVFCSYAWNLVDIILIYITFSVSMYIMCVCLFSALSRRVGTLQITIIIIIIPLQQHLAQWQCWLLFTNDHTRHFFKRCDICKVAKGGSWKLVNHCNWSDTLCQTTTRTLEANTLLPSRKTPNYLPFPSTAHPPTRTLSLYCFFYV